MCMRSPAPPPCMIRTGVRRGRRSKLGEGRVFMKQRVGLSSFLYTSLHAGPPVNLVESCRTRSETRSPGRGPGRDKYWRRLSGCGGMLRVLAPASWNYACGPCDPSGSVHHRSSSRACLTVNDELETGDRRWGEVVLRLGHFAGSFRRGTTGCVRRTSGCVKECDGVIASYRSMCLLRFVLRAA